MTTQWLAAENFELSHAVISAINTLSIHAKLTLAHADSFPPEQVERARKYLREFLDRFERVVGDVEFDQDAPVLGIEPRMGSLAKRYVAARHRAQAPSSLYRIPLAELTALLDSEHPEDLERLVDSLRALRALVEENAHEDVVDILGEL